MTPKEALKKLHYAANSSVYYQTDSELGYKKGIQEMQEAARILRDCIRGL